MVKSTKNTTSDSSSSQPVVMSDVPASAPVRRSKVVSSETVVAPPGGAVETPVKKAREPKVKAEKVEPVVGDEKEEADSSSETAKRVTPTKESVMLEFDSLLADFEADLEKNRESATKTKGVKSHRSFLKRMKVLRTHTARVMKQKRVSTTVRKPNSGFNKPVPISKELSKFCGWKAGELHSRVDVTKALTAYVKEHALQDTTNGSIILVDKDPKFRAILGFDSKQANKPIRYCDIQTRIKGHFPKVDPTASVASESVA